MKLIRTKELGGKCIEIIDFSPYSINIYVYLSNDIESINSAFNTSLENDFKGISTKINDGKFLIIINTKPKKKNIPASILLHECYHCINQIIESYESSGLCFEGNEELRARLMQNLTRTVLKGFNKHILLG